MRELPWETASGDSQFRSERKLGSHAEFGTAVWSRTAVIDDPSGVVLVQRLATAEVRYWEGVLPV
jgi:hypothetical protein